MATSGEWFELSASLSWAGYELKSRTTQLTLMFGYFLVNVAPSCLTSVRRSPLSEVQTVSVWFPALAGSNVALGAAPTPPADAPAAIVRAAPLSRSASFFIGSSFARRPQNARVVLRASGEDTNGISR